MGLSLEHAHAHVQHFLMQFNCSWTVTFRWASSQSYLFSTANTTQWNVNSFDLKFNHSNVAIQWWSISNCLSCINIPKVIKAAEKAHPWPELMLLYIKLWVPHPSIYQPHVNCLCRIMPPWQWLSDIPMHGVTIHMDSFLFFPHLLHSDSHLSCLWLIAPTLTLLWLISLTPMTHRSHTYSTVTHLPLLYFYYIYG